MSKQPLELFSLNFLLCYYPLKDLDQSLLFVDLNCFENRIGSPSTTIVDFLLYHDVCPAQ